MRADTFTRWTVMVAALVSTGYAEHHLGTWIGWDWRVAFVIPVVADLYMIYATRSGRDVIPAVSVVIALSATNYLATSPIDPVKTSISVAVSSLAPLVLWRLHANHRTSEHASPEEKVLTPLAEKRPDLIWGKPANTATIESRPTEERKTTDEVPPDARQEHDLPRDPEEEHGRSQGEDAGERGAGSPEAGGAHGEAGSQAGGAEGSQGRAKLTREEQESVIYDAWVHKRSADSAAKESGKSVATVYRRFKVYAAA